MPQQLVMPEIQAAIENLQTSIAQAEEELEQLAEARKQKKEQIRNWRKGVKTLNGKDKP